MPGEPKRAEEHDKAQKLLRRWKQRPPEVVVDPDAFAAAGDDYAGRLPERVGAITAELDRLSALSAPGLAASRILPWFYVLAMGLLTAVAAVGLGPSKGPLAAGAVVVCAAGRDRRRDDHSQRGRAAESPKSIRRFSWPSAK